MYKLSRVIKSYRPLACGQDYMIVARGRVLYKADLDLTNIRLLCTLPPQHKIETLPRLRSAERILRLGISSFLLLDEEWGLAVRGSTIFRVNIQSGVFKLEFTIPNGRKILTLSYIKGETKVQDTIMFGEYFENMDMAPVNAWSCPVDQPGDWKIAFTYPSGSINHIHNIVPAPELGGVIILAGDFEQAAGIWLYSIKSQKLTPILIGSQAYRATWLCQLNNSYFYATDSQLSPNSLCQFHLNEGIASANTISEIEGSSIYAGYGKQYCYFSSTVEPGAPTGNFLRDVFERTPGPGILSSSAYIYAIDASGELQTLFSSEKDIWPMRLGQFGTFSFPSGVMPDGRFYAYGQALKMYDDCCLIFEKV